MIWGFFFAPKQMSFLKDKSVFWFQMKNKNLTITKAAVCLPLMVPPSTAEKERNEEKKELVKKNKHLSCYMLIHYTIWDTIRYEKKTQKTN